MPSYLRPQFVECAAAWASDVQDVLYEAVNLARRLHVEVRFSFNDVRFHVRSGSDVATLRERYHEGKDKTIGP